VRVTVHDPVVVYYHQSMDDRGRPPEAPALTQERLRPFKERLQKEPAPAPVAVCITGMHRSGTSAIAGMLNACGIALGGPGSFLPPANDNPRGFWEEQEFVLLNEALLAARGGGWDMPPETMADWERAPTLVSLRARAATLLEDRMGSGRPWAVKDPRAMLNASFWKLIVPDIRFVVCLRNPLAVAESLAKRNGVSQARAFSLWEIYYRALCDTTTRAERIVTAFDDYASDPDTELRRVLAALGIQVSAPLVTAASAEMVSALRHHEATAEDLVASRAPASVVSLYLDLCAEAAGTNADRGVKERAVGAAIALCSREEYGASLREFRANRLLAEQAFEIQRLRAQVMEAETNRQREAAAAAQALESSRNWERHYAALRDHADELGRQARVLEAILEKQRGRQLALRIFRRGRHAVQKLVGKSR
jgi:hypothetical protein